MRKIFILIFFVFAFCFGVDYYDWNTRTDRDGKPAGIFVNTPYPVDENSTSYTVKSDEYPSGKTYTLGTKYYVDSAAGNDANDGTTLELAKKTIASAITAAGNGNKTIIVRSGTYNEYNLTSGYGTDDTHRWTIIGYKQERPIITGLGNTNSSIDIFKSTGQTSANVTLQRLKLFNNLGQAVRLGTNSTTKRDNRFNLIDIWIDSCNSSSKNSDDGNVYYLNADSGWIYHCTSEKSYGHTLKIGDGASDCIVEWSISRHAGYMAGMDTATYWGSHSGAIQIVSDAGVYGRRNAVRYCIVDTALFAAIELRRAPAYSLHHNEIWGAPQFFNISGAENHGQGVNDPTNSLLLITNDSTYGNIYANVVRESGLLESGKKATGIGFSSIVNTGTNVTYIYNNLFYGFNWYTIYQKSNCTDQNIELYNNTVIDSSTSTSLYFANTTGTRKFINNIVYNLSAGSCVSLTSGFTKNNNLYYYPIGTRGYSNPIETGGVENDPLLITIPRSGLFSPNYAKTQIGSPIKNAGEAQTYFTLDMFEKSRIIWDIGCYAVGKNISIIIKR